MKILGIDGMSTDQLRFEIQRGAKLVCYSYCISLVVITFRRSSDVYYIPAGESAVPKGLPWTLLSVVAGWWGIPWGPIFTIQSLVTNFQGGKDITADFSAHLARATAAPLATAKA
ncbi:MAG TPA: hypothetical protein VFE61_06865 [Candidatus Sulfotelmatobacter sp.]|nr:hypothetical protein [Candidatus Sulfotelmatobacter sp.]